MRVFVSGATGFVGRRLAESLAAGGHRVRTLARRESAAAPLAEMGVDVVLGDLTDYAAVREATDGCEVVYHLAGALTNSGLDEAGFRAVNVAGTEYVARAAAEADVRRLVYCSTVAVYGQAGRLPVDERAPARPDSAYARTKLRGEEIVLERAREGGAPATVARLTRVYGPGDLTFLRVFKDVLAGRFVMIGSGEHAYHLTYVDDAVAGLEACGGERARPGERYIVGGGEVATLRRFVETIAEEGGVAAPRRRVPAAPLAAAAVAARLLMKPFGREPNLMHKLNFFTLPYAFDVSKARAELEFRPAVSLREGVGRTIAWYRRHGHL